MGEQVLPTSATPTLPLSKSKLQISISCVSGGKVTQAELWSHALPRSIYRRMNTLPRNSALDPSLCHASRFLVGYKVSGIPAVAPHWKGQLLHYYFLWQFKDMLPLSLRNISGRYAAERWSQSGHRPVIHTATRKAGGSPWFTGRGKGNVFQDGIGLLLCGTTVAREKAENSL